MSQCIDGPVFALGLFMPRNRNFVHQPGVFHVGSRTNNKEWFEMPLPQVWELSTDLLWFSSRAFGVELQAFVLMSNHYHLLLRTSEANLPAFMCYFSREMSRAINREMGRINHIFGARYFASLVDDWKYHHAVYKYIYRNPVDAGLGKKVELYPYSTLQGLLGFSRLPVGVVDPLELVERPEETLDWLNFSFHEDQRECIRKGLKGARFEWKTGRRKRNCWTNDLVFPTNAEGYQKVGGTFGQIFSF
ncbi:MAG: transposase [Bdellovibrionaceae bacterium]|nr:transposase [Pseudobdellovibrionaceae bacterium]